MGVGKTIEGISTLYLQIQNTLRQHQAKKLPLGYVFKPSLWVTKPELDRQSIEDFMLGYQGLLRFYVLTAHPKKRYPQQIHVVRNNKEWQHVANKLYEDRFLPEVGTISYCLLSPLFQLR